MDDFPTMFRSHVTDHRAIGFLFLFCFFYISAIDHIEQGLVNVLIEQILEGDVQNHQK